MEQYIQTALEHPDFFTTIIILWFIFVFFVPVFWYLLKWQTKQNKEVVNEINLWMNQLVKTLKEHDESSKTLTKEILASVWKTRLNKWQTIEVAKKYVLSASFEKLDYIRDRLEKNDIQKYKEQIIKQLKAELIRISEKEYITPLNSYATPIGNIWDWVKNNFEFEPFFNEVCDIFFSEKIEDVKKITYIQTIMKTYQNHLWSKLYTELNK